MSALVSDNFDIASLTTYTQSQLNTFVIARSLTIIGKRTKELLKDALTKWQNIQDAAAPQAFDHDDLQSYTAKELLDFCKTFNLPVAARPNPTEKTMKNALTRYHNSVTTTGSNPSLPLSGRNAPTISVISPVEGIITTTHPMFDTMDSDDEENMDEKWSLSYTSINSQKSAVPTKPAFQGLESMEFGSMLVNRFAIFFHTDGQISLYCNEPDGHLTLRTNDLGVATPAIVTLQANTLVWVLSSTTCGRYLKTSNDPTNTFTFNNNVNLVLGSTKRKLHHLTTASNNDSDDENRDVQIIGGSSNSHLMALANAMSKIPDTAAKKFTAQACHLSEALARSFTKNPDRLLKTGALIMFTQLNSPPADSGIPYRWFGADWNRDHSFMIQMQVGHIFRLLSGWNLVGINYFADLLDKYENFDASLKITAIAQSISHTNYDIVDTIKLDDKIILNDLSHFIKALNNYCYVLDTIYEFRAPIATALQGIIGRIAIYLRNKTLGPHNDGTNVMFMCVAFHFQKSIQDIYSTAFANTDRTRTIAIVAAFDAIPDFSPDGQLGAQLSSIRTTYQPSNMFAFLSSSANPLHTTTPLTVTAGGVSKNQKRRQALKLKMSAVPTTVTGTATTTVAAAPGVALPTTPICGWYLAGQCNSTPCTRDHRKPLASDSHSVSNFFKQRKRLTQTIF